MALFKSGSAAPSSAPVAADFCDYTDTFGNQPVLVTCDMNFYKSLPVPTLPYCVKVQIEINADPSNPDLISDAELAHVTNMRSIIGQHIKGRYVGQGIVASQNTLYFMIYVADTMSKTSKNMLEQTKSTTFRRLDYSITYDPEGNEYLEYLYPNELQKKQIENRKILRSLRGYGDDGTASRKIRFHVAFPNRKAALDFFTATSEKGFAYESLTQEPAPKDMVLPRYHLVLVREFPFDLELLDLVDNYLLQLCEQYEGDFRSVETDVV